MRNTYLPVMKVGTPYEPLVDLIPEYTSATDNFK